MILTCPSCATRYSIDPAALGQSGREVRCIRCAHTWHQTPEGRSPDAALVPPPDEPPITDAIEPAMTDVIEPTGPPMGPAGEPDRRSGHGWVGAARPERRRRDNLAGWAIFIAVVAALTLGGYFARQQIVDRWPPTANIYALVGVPVLPFNPLGFELANLSQKNEIEAGVAVLKISGDIVNITAEARAAPRVRIGIRDSSAKEIHHWTAQPLATKVGPGAMTSFITRLENPPPAARDILLTLVGADDGPGGEGE